MSTPVMAAIVGVVVIGGAGAIMMATRGGDDPISGGSGDSTAMVAANNPAADTPGAAAGGETTATASGQDSAVVTGGAGAAETQATADSTPATPPTPDPEPDPDPEPAPPQISPAQRRWNAEVTQRVAQIDAQAGGQGYLAVGSPITGSLADDGRRTHTINLRANRQYALLGFCDSDCNDLDLVISDASGGVIDSDYAVDAQPVVSLTTAAAGQFSVEVRMPGCTTSSCRYAFRVFARDEATPPQRPRKQ